MFQARAAGAKHMTLGRAKPLFVDVEMGMQPKSTGDKVFDAMLGRLYFRRWLDQSIDALRLALAKI
jgi:hypothetical protein